MKFATTFVFFLCSLSAAAQTWPNAPEPKRFFDRETVIELSFSAAALAADGYTTYDAPNSYPETNPFLRADHAYLSKRGVSLYFAGVMGAEVGTMYVFRRHRMIKRLIPVAVTAVEIIQVARNHSAR